eukprot:TRINITY_DN545_c0_g3_i1.p1 TRINITY_DN545_c0_g3~~TRINITY_DN545_c0_g3_i1.p1  ORF type:complete len:528 (+),score=100.09 TRINITY_DN545_c0_g3_i1:610-2193(+)
MANGRVDLLRNKEIRAVVVTNTKYPSTRALARRMCIVYAPTEDADEVMVPPVRQLRSDFRDAMTVNASTVIKGLPESVSSLGQYQYHITLRIHARTHNELAPKAACHEPFMFALGPRLPAIAASCTRPPAPWLPQPSTSHTRFNSVHIVKKNGNSIDFDDLIVIVGSSEAGRNRDSKGVETPYQALPQSLPNHPDGAHHLAIMETRALVRRPSQEHGRVELRRDVKYKLAIVTDVHHDDVPALGRGLRLMFARSTFEEQELEVPNVRVFRDQFKSALEVKTCALSRALPAHIASLGRYTYCFEVAIHARTHNELAPASRRHEPFMFALAQTQEHCTALAPLLVDCNFDSSPDILAPLSAPHPSELQPLEDLESLISHSSPVPDNSATLACDMAARAFLPRHDSVDDSDGYSDVAVVPVPTLPSLDPLGSVVTCTPGKAILSSSATFASDEALDLSEVYVSAESPNVTTSWCPAVPGSVSTGDTMPMSFPLPSSPHTSTASSESGEFHYTDWLTVDDVSGAVFDFASC